jgi:hypothetical protein
VLIDLYRGLLHYLPAILIALPILYWAYREWNTDRRWRIALWTTVALGAANAVVFLLSQISLAPQHTWSACRLAWAISWLKGYRLYYPLGEGPVLVQMYGPVSAIVYAAGALASRPTAAILIATFFGTAIYILPATWFLLRSSPAGGRVYGLAAAVTFVLISSQQFVLSEAATRITIDAPAAGLGTCALALLSNRRLERPWKTGALCGLFAGLAMWTKLTLAPIAAALLLYALLIAGFRPALRFGIAMAGVMMLLSGCLAICFGKALFVQNILVPSSQPWEWSGDGRVVAFVRAMGWIWHYSKSMAAIFALAMLVRLASSRPQRVPIARFASDNPWLLPLLAAICLLPTATLAYVKVGGAWNNAVIISYMLLLAGMSALLPRSTQSAAPGERVLRGALLPRLCLVTLAAATTYIAWQSAPAVRAGLAAWANLEDNPQEAAYRYARLHPGEIYFPSAPLSTLLAEGRLDHFNAGVDDLDLAGFRISDEHLHRYLPPHMSAIAFRSPPRPRILLRFPQFDHDTTVPELQGWILRSRQIRPSTAPEEAQE